MAELGGIADEPVDPMPTMEHSMLLDDLSDAADRPADLCGRRRTAGRPWRSCRSATSAGPSGVTTTPTASATPRQPYLLFALGVPAVPELATAIAATFDRLDVATEGHTNGRTVPNFLGADGDLERAWYPATRARAWPR